MALTWLDVTSLPRIDDGLSSAMYIGTVDANQPTPTPTMMRPATNTP